MKLSPFNVNCSDIQSSSSSSSNAALSPKSISVTPNATDNIFPDCWSDDERMSCLMSMFKNRSVNPVEYDSKMKFWTNLILSSSSQCKKPSFTYGDLMQRFRRKDRLPAGLNVVIRDMWTKGDIILLQDYALSGSGWISWSFEIAVKKPLGWLFGYNHADDFTKNEFVIPKVLDELCHKVMEIRRSMQENASPTSDVRRSNIIEYKKFVKIMQPHGFDDKCVYLIIEQLRRIGLISIDHSDKGEKLIKFPDEESGDSNTAITDSDKKFYKLQKMVETLETELQKLEEAASKLDSEARAAVRSQNRPKAKQCLRQQKSVLNQIRVKEAALNNGMNLMNQLAQTKEQKQILDAFKAGVAAFKNDLAEHGISPDKVDETMDDVHEALSDQQDISEALARSPVPSSAMSAVSDAELEDELADLLREPDVDIAAKGKFEVYNLPDGIEYSPLTSLSSKLQTYATTWKNCFNKGFKLPDVPSSVMATSTPKTKFTSDEDNIARLKRLLEADQ